MAKTKISEFSSTPGDNTDIDNINIAEGCAPSGINNAIRELMAQLKDFQAGTAGDSFNGPIGTTTAAAGVFTTLSASGAFTYGGVTLSNAVTGTGNMVLSNSPTLVTPALGTPSSATLTNATGLPIATGVSGLGTGVATFLATPSSANLAAAVSDETGTGALVFANSPTLVTPALGTPSALVGTNITGTAAGLSIGGNAATATTSTNVSGGTASVTTLTTSGAVTHNGGTANGVAYLNGSKVLTTGSALTFDGTSLGFGGNLNSTLTSEFYIQSPAGTNFIGVNQTSGYVRVAAGGAIVLNLSNTAATFNLNSAEQMRLNSTGLGIGTSSPTYKLDVRGTISSGLNYGGVLSIYDTLTSSRVGYVSTDAQTTGNNDTNLAIVADQAGKGIKFFTNNSATLKAFLDSSGNLGLGVTPSAWASGNPAMQFKYKGSIWNNIDLSMHITQNAYFDGSNWIRENTSQPSNYYQFQGQHIWRTAPSGTAGNAISFTQAMTLDASGNLLVGTTSSVETNLGARLGADGYVRSTRAATVNTASTLDVYSTGAGAFRFYVGMGGTVFATSTTISAISDQRLKENVQDIDAGLDKIMALKPRKFDWKAGKGKDIKGDRGWIAQEFEQVFPDMIDTWKDESPEGEEPYKSVRADLIPVLVKAIQEQQAIITALTARVAALESN